MKIAIWQICKGKSQLKWQHLPVGIREQIVTVLVLATCDEMHLNFIRRICGNGETRLFKKRAQRQMLADPGILGMDVGVTLLGRLRALTLHAETSAMSHEVSPMTLGGYLSSRTKSLSKGPRALYRPLGDPQ